jgi:hypothetical protein
MSQSARQTLRNKQHITSGTAVQLLMTEERLNFEALTFELLTLYGCFTHNQA